MTRPADPKYETVLRETQRRVPLQATDADIVAYHRGMRAIDHRVDELTRIEGVLSRAMRKVKAKKVRLADERSRLGAASDRDVVERLVTCEVVYDARQGGAIFVRQKGETTVIAGSERPVSADERAVIAALEREPPGAEDEGLASKLRLMEYASDAPPDDIKSQVDEAIDASHLPPELQEALLALEEEDEEPEPKASKPKKEKAPKPAKAPSEKKKGGKKKGAAAAPPPAPEAAAPASAADENAEPGPAEIEPDECPKPPTPRAPVADDTEPVSEEDATAEPEPTASEAEEPADEAAADDAETDSGAGADASSGDESDGADDADAEAGDPAGFTGDDQPPPVEASGDGDVTDDAAEGEPAADPYPEAYDADGADEDEPPWEDGSAPAAAEAALPADDHVPEYEDLTVVRDGAGEPSPVAEPAAAAPPPAPEAAPEPEPTPPPAVVAAPAPTEKKAPAKKKKAGDAAAPAPADGAAPIGVAPSNGVVAHTAANGAAAAPPPAPVVTPTPAPAATPAASATPARTAENNFGLSPAIAGKFGEAVVQFLGKEPLLASTASAALSKRFGTVVTPNLEAALLPMLNHLATQGTIQRRPAGNDMIFHIPEHAGTVDGWYEKQRRANA